MKKKSMVGWVSQSILEGTGFDICGPYYEYRMLYLMERRLPVYKRKTDIMDREMTDDPSIIKKVRVTIEIIK